MISMQIRVYNPDLSFSKTLSVTDATPEIIDFTVGVISKEVLNGVPANSLRKPFNFCNMMIRENGKLVSYKKFVK